MTVALVLTEIKEKLGRQYGSLSCPPPPHISISYCQTLVEFPPAFTESCTERFAAPEFITYHVLANRYSKNHYFIEILLQV